MKLLYIHHFEGVRSEGVGPEVDFLHCPPPPTHTPFIFLLDNVPFRVVSRLRRRWLRLLLLRILRKIGALETLEVWGMEKEVGLWEVVASWRDLGMGNKLGKILLLDKVYTSKNNQLRNSRL